MITFSYFIINNNKFREYVSIVDGWDPSSVGFLYRTLIRKTGEMLYYHKVRRSLSAVVASVVVEWRIKRKNHRWRVPWKLSPTGADRARLFPAAIGFNNGITVKTVPQWMVRRMPFAMVSLSLVSVPRWKFLVTHFSIGYNFSFRSVSSTVVHYHVRDQRSICCVLNLNSEKKKKTFLLFFEV